MSRAKGWTCRAVSQGVKCGMMNRPRTRKCGSCGKPRPTRKRPAHMAALDLPYEHYVEINGGETCGVCGCAPSPNRRLDRDHDHRGNGRARGLLCHRDNRLLASWVTPELLRAAADYLERTT